ncbi:unnamed protein product [Miscanthus lutarioriparius]|uniref:RPN1 N-terminal domain-containing protein n=1 Tax=Miscanthus lutarioriparius TaxID=422564 RepID=A0A811R103_9POAL|nr:unnamed protein product [Miscanthus lutarioriparius]
MEIPEVYLSVLASHEVLLASQICLSPVQVYVVVLQEIRSAMSSMTWVLKPLKFLFSHFGTLKSYFETIPEYDLKKCVNTLDHPASKYMADIPSVLALTMSIEGERECVFAIVLFLLPFARFFV